MAQDVYHSVVRTALERDGWTITDDPLTLEFGSTSVYVDLGAEAAIGAEKEGRKIAVEIKSFISPSAVYDLQRALGQYIFYDFLLSRQQPDRLLYLAVPEDTYMGILSEYEARELLAAQGIRLLVFNPLDEVVIRWNS